VGCYGLSLTGEVVDLAARFLGRPLGEWPAVEVEWASPLLDPPTDGVFGPAKTVLPLLTGGHVVLYRERRLARFHKPGPPNGHDVAHPCLASVGVVFARWDGRVPLHAGAVVIGDRAWGVLGSREAGKSTTLAYLAEAGYAVLADDLVVIDRGQACAGPRTLDLREATAQRIDGRNQLVEVRQGEKHRMFLPPVPPTVPLAGLFVLGVGEEVSVQLVPPVERLQLLQPHLKLWSIGFPASGVLQLLSLPMWRLSRSRAWSDLPRLIERLVDTAAA
jgi:hypothetical protein